MREFTLQEEVGAQMAAASMRALFPGHYLKQFMAAGLRPDARGFGEARKTACTPGVISGADGSAAVQVGRTAVVAGARLSTFSPPATGSAAGRLAVVVDLGQAASLHNGARPEDTTVAISEFVRDTLHYSGVVNEDDLIIKTGAAAWTVTLSITCLNHDGNVLDALLLAAVAALLDTKVPAVELSDSGVVSESSAQATALKVNALPISVTVALFERIEGGTPDMVIDPTAEEEKLCQAKITIVVVLPAATNWKTVASSAPIMVHKHGGLPIPESCVKKAIQCARERALGTAGLLQMSSA